MEGGGKSFSKMCMLNGERRSLLEIGYSKSTLFRFRKVKSGLDGVKSKKHL